jgi:hypothetical protein
MTIDFGESIDQKRNKLRETLRKIPPKDREDEVNNILAELVEEERRQRYFTQIGLLSTDELGEIIRQRKRHEKKKAA